MARPAAGREGHEVEADRRQREVGPASREPAGGGEQSAALREAHRLQGLVQGPAALDFHNCHDAVSHRQDVDLRLMGAEAKPQQAVAFRQEDEGAEDFGAASGAPRKSAAARKLERIGDGASPALSSLDRFQGVRPSLIARARA